MFCLLSLHDDLQTAGASQHALAEETTPDVTKKLFDLNTVAPINLTQALLPHVLTPSPQADSSQAGDTSHPQRSSNLQQTSQPPQQNAIPQHGASSDPPRQQQAQGGQQGCHIVVVGSMAGVVPAPGQAVYSACKTALKGYFGSLQSELAARWDSAVYRAEHCVRLPCYAQVCCTSAIRLAGMVQRFAFISAQRQLCLWCKTMRYLITCLLMITER